MMPITNQTIETGVQQSRTKLRENGHSTGSQAALHVPKQYKTATSSTNDEQIIDKSIQVQRVLRSKSLREEKNTPGAQLLSSTETLMGKRQSTGTKDPIDSAQTNKLERANPMTGQKQPALKSLAAEHNLLTKTELNELCRRERRKSGGVRTESNTICSVIKGLHVDIEHVYPAYKPENENEIVFVVLCKKEIQIECEWTLVLKILHQKNKENNVNNPLPRATANEISKVIDKCAHSLMEEHMYLAAITAGKVPHGTVQKEEACIILYVLAKHFIPLNEEAFQKELDNIPVDVREGDFRLCVGSADEVQNNLRMGCKITSNLMQDAVGTLGGFIEHPVYGLCGLTCAHVFINDDRHFDLQDKGKKKNDELHDFTIYQSSYEGQNKVGPLVEMIYKEGNGKPGVDLALVKVENLAPTSGSFHDPNGIQNESFRSGFAWGKAGLPSDDRDVIKFGQATNRTAGEILYVDSAVKEIRFEKVVGVYDQEKRKKKKLTSSLFKQYLIKPKNETFCAPGDSGALVFMKDKEQNDLRCIGMIVGMMNDGMCIVTPIQAILEEVNVAGLKSFHFKYTMDEMDQRFNKLEKRMTDIVAETIRSENRKLKRQSAMRNSIQVLMHQC